MGAAFIQIVDEHDEPTGVATKQEAWDKGLIHRIVRIMIVNSRGQLLLQHRDPSKDIFPNCWDCSVGGHVDAGETYGPAAQREMAEELGLEGVKLHELGKYRSDETLDKHRYNRFTQCYTASLDVTPAKLEVGKVDGVRWFTLDEVKQLIKDHPDQVTDGLRQVIEWYY